MKRVLVIVVTHNGMHWLERCLSSVYADADLYVWDNDSTDGSADIAARAGAIVCHEFRQGKGNVIRSMFYEIDADCYLLVDGDDTYSAEDAPIMVDGVLSGKYDMVIGDRLSSTYFTENKRPFHNSGNLLVRTLVNWLFHGHIMDVMTGYRAFNRSFVKLFPILSGGFEVETEMTIHALDKNLSVASIPVGYRDRPEGSVSKLNTFQDGFKVLKTILLLFKDYKPLLFFSALACVSLLCALVSVAPVLLEYCRTGLVPRMPTFVASCFLALFALHLFTCGLILDTQGKRSRQL